MTVILPLVIALLSGVLLIILGKAPRWRRAAVVAGMSAFFVSGLMLVKEVMAEEIIVLHLGSWRPPVGIVFVADLFSASLVAMAGLVGVMTALYGLGSHDGRRDEIGYHPVTFFLLAGVTGAFLTGDMFNLYVWFELILLSSFILLSLGDDRPHLRAAIHYVMLNLVGSALFLAGLGLLYGATGTLNMAELAGKMTSISPPVAITIGTLITIAFCVKAAVFPFSSWLPASYPAAPTGIAALFAALLTKVGVYCLYRAGTVTFQSLPDFYFNTLAVLAVATGIIAGLAALVQNDIRRVFAFLLVSHVGLMVLGLSISLRDGVAYTLQHMAVICALYLMVGLITAIGGSVKLSELGGLGKSHPWLGTLFLLAAFSLAGVPPLSGFWPKLGMLTEAVNEKATIPLIAVVLVGILTLGAVVRVWQIVFWRPCPNPDLEPFVERPVRMTAMLIPIVALVCLSLGAGLAAGPFYEFATTASDQLENPGEYVSAVLEGGKP